MILWFLLEPVQGITWENFQQKLFEEETYQIRRDNSRFKCWGPGPSRYGALRESDRLQTGLYRVEKRLSKNISSISKGRGETSQTRTPKGGT